MPDALPLDGKVALVTGGGRGLAKAMAIALAGSGADVAVGARTEKELAETGKEVEALGRRAVALPVDVRDPSAVQRVVDRVMEEFGAIDILVNGAGMNIRKPIIEVTVEDWDFLMEVNLRGAFFVAQAVARAMIPRRRGKIINIASVASEIGLPNICMYCASKGGVAQMTKAMAVEWAPYRINVNAIGPGYFRTFMTESLFATEESVAELVRRIPQGRTGVPGDLAGTTVFLASAASDYITGHVLYVDGGLLAG